MASHLQSTSEDLKRPSTIPHPHTHTFLTSSFSLLCAHPVFESVTLAGLLVPKLARYAAPLAFALALVHPENAFTSEILMPLPISSTSLFKHHFLREAFPDHPTSYCTLLHFLPSTSHHPTQHQHIITAVVLCIPPVECIGHESKISSFQFTPISPAPGARLA